MKITVLGCYGPYPKAGGACSGYLLEDKDLKILIDCGNGVISRLFQYCQDINDLDAIFISHLHPDHMSDLMVLKYAIGIGQMQGKVKQSMPVYLPSSPKEDYDRIQYNDAFVRNVIREDLEIDIKGMKVTFQKTDHPIECYGMSFEKNGKRFVYSGDTKFFNELENFAKDCDLFLCEGGILEKDRTENTPHLSARQAAEVAANANLKRVVLTHFWPEVKPYALYTEAREFFPNILELAEEGKAYFI